MPPITRDRIRDHSCGLELRADVLTALMIERGWKTARLARETGIHQTHLTRIITGQTPPTHDSVGRLMHAFPRHAIEHLFAPAAARDAA